MELLRTSTMSTSHTQVPLHGTAIPPFWKAVRTGSPTQVVSGIIHYRLLQTRVTVTTPPGELGARRFAARAGTAGADAGAASGCKRRCRGPG